MVDRDFDAQLSRLFADPPAFSDAEAFRARVESRLDRGWTLRRLAIGAAGGVAGLFAVGQLITSRFATDLRHASSEGVSGVDLGVDKVMAQVNQFVSTPASVETLWLGAALAAIALTFAITRLVEEF
ncbi:hypothetical protein V7S57_10345 [Caulobacter sp. CCNWLY153]|jgi:hypothetical protein|uniref:Uncharacterized protein n=1 Tax=Caulobacter radicis TaxID=2172650 RepID=A0A2T9JWA4_9CAUL|nr:hypothetical protein [Caulobacter radicis]PVM87949.1 hypothetical protein DDF65_03215 [Caulobacter radicis]